MLILRSIFWIFLLFHTQLTHLNASDLLNFDSSNRFLPIACQSWCSGVSKMATYIPIYIYISCRFICSKISLQDEDGNNVITGTPANSAQTNYLNLDSTLTKSDDVFTCLVEVTPAETAIFTVPLNTFSKFSTFYNVLVFD